MTVQLLGWAGAALVVLAYGLAAAGRARADAPTSLMLNAAGSAGVLVSCVTTAAWPSAALNVMWLLISARALRSAVRSGIETQAST